MAKNEAKIKFTAETSDFNSAIGKASNTIDEMKSALQLNEAQMKSSGSSVEGLEERQQLLAQQMEATQAKTEALNGKLQKAVEIFGENSAEASKLRKQLNNSKIAEQKLQQQINKCNAELQEQQSSSKKTASATESLSDKIDAQENDLKALKKAYVEASLQYGKNSNAAKELEGKIKSLSSELKDNKKKMSEAEKAADELAGGMEDAGGGAKDAGDSAEDSSDGWTILKDVIADLVRDAISWAIESFKELATAGEDALAQIGASTGATSREMAQYKGVMQEIYRAGYGEDYEDIGDAMKYVNTILGDMDSASMQEVTQNAILFRDVFDIDYQESIRAVNSMMDQFGVSATDAYNLMAQGAQNGLNQNGDLADVINEYSMHFAAAGYSADEMFNMLNNGVAEGVWNVDKLGDSVKELGIRARDGSAAEALKTYRKQLGLSSKDVKRLSASMAKGGEEGRAAYDEIKTALSGVDDATKRNQIGVALFGTMWEDLGEEAIMALLDTQGELSSTKDAMSEVAGMKLDTLSASWKELGRIFQTDLIQPLVDTFAPMAKSVVDWLIRNMPIVKPIVVALATAFGVLAGALAISGLIKGVSAAVAVLNATLLANPIVLIVAAIAGLVAAFVYLWNNCEAFRNFWIAVWDAIVGAVTAAWNWIVGAVQAVKTGVVNAWNAIKTGVATAVSAVVNAVTTAWNTVKTWTATAFNAVKTSITTVWNGIKTGVSTAVESVKTGVSNAWSNIKTAAGTAWESIRSGVVQKANAIKTGASQAWTAMHTAASAKWESLKSKASTVWEGIKFAMTNPLEAAKTAINNVIETIKGYFNFEWQLPQIKLPHFTKTGETILGLPKIGVEWYAKGGIMTQPTIFGAAGGTFLGGGEAGPEAILPIDKMEDYVASAVDKHMSVVNLELLADKIEELASRPINLSVNGRQFALATAGDGDRVNGLRSTFKNRGLLLE